LLSQASAKNKATTKLKKRRRHLFLESPLIFVPPKDARRLLVNIATGPDAGLREASKAAKIVSEAVGSDALII
jgi:cell division GTPase FtsZ